MPVRKIPKNYRNITGRIAVSDGSEPKGFESSLERDFLILLDFDITVVRFEEQPATISYNDQEGRARTYTPDVLAFYRTDIPFSRKRVPCLFEVKYREDLKKGWKEFRPKFKAAIRYAKKRGWKFKIITERGAAPVFLDTDLG
ncbi:MAG: TnsA endonuclease N-terminal domain-containing protein [Desulfuromonadales bacterium]|nr:TnsA endonuclease N-terminal domain-containing protein [Desulfuromonadales bacterium]